MNRPEPKYPIGTTFTTRGKHGRKVTVVDIHQTYNLKGERVAVEYQTEHEFCGQTVHGEAVETTITLGNPKLPEKAKQTT